MSYISTSKRVMRKDNSNALGEALLDLMDIDDLLRCLRANRTA